MGLFSKIFGGRSSAPSQATTDAEDLAKKEQEEADRKKAEADALLAEQKKKTKEYTARTKQMQGGGREGLMFRNNQAGVA